MRFLLAASVASAILAVAVAQVHGQNPGDPVTYTNGGVVYTAVLDPDLDTVSDAPVSTIAAGGAAAGGAAGGAGVLSTTYDYYGNPVTISNGVTLGTFLTGPTAAAATTTAAANNAGGVSISSTRIGEKGDDIGNQSDDQAAPLLFQPYQRRSISTPHPDQPIDSGNDLRKRQAALGGGGGGAQTTQTGLQTISGYNPPANTDPPTPENYSSGSILVPSQIPGYTGKENSQGVSSGAIRLGAAKTVVGAAIGAAVFAFL